jgi:hypothetical protein
MLTFRINMLSPSSEAEVTREGSRGLIQDLKSKGWGKGLASTPEDGDSLFLRNGSIDLQIHMAPKPKTSTT